MNSHTLKGDYMEEWRAVKGYEFRYQASSLGRIRNADTNHILKPRLDLYTGYYKVSIKIAEKKFVNKYVHRMVAQAFLEKKEGQIEVNHIDSNKTNNCVNNLEWVTSKENTKHAVYKGNLNAWNNPITPVIATCIATGEEKYYCTMREAERSIGSRHIVDVLKGRRQSCKGYHFRYAKGGDANDYHDDRTAKRETETVSARQA